MFKIFVTNNVIVFNRLQNNRYSFQERKYRNNLKNITFRENRD